jgi:hypothetical protein
VIDHHLLRQVVLLDETGQVTADLIQLSAGGVAERSTRALTPIHCPFRVQGETDIRFLEPLLKGLRLGDELRSTRLKIE